MHADYKKHLLVAVLFVSLLPCAPVVAGTIADSIGSFKIAADLSRRSSQESAVKQAAAIITTVIASDVTLNSTTIPNAPTMAAGAGPSGGGLVPPGIGAPTKDGYGRDLGYCAWDNVTGASTGRISGTAGDVNAKIFAVVSAGLDGVFNRTCAQIFSSTATTDDDFVVFYTTPLLKQGVGGTVYYGDPVADKPTLLGLTPALQKDGEIRLVKADNSLWRWNTVSQSWVNTSIVPYWSGGSTSNQTFTNLQVGIGTNNPGYSLEVSSTGIPIGLRSSSQFNGINFLNGAAVSGFVGYDNTGSRLYLNAATGSTIDFAIGGTPQLSIAANGLVTTASGLAVNNGLNVVSGALSAANVALSGGSINGTAIGNVTPSTGAFTTLSGTLSGNVNGNAATASKLLAPVSIGMSGDASWSVSFDGSSNVSGVMTLSNSGAAAGTYGSATTSPTFTVDAKGRLTAAANVTITPAFSSITGLPATATGYGIASIDAVPVGSTTRSTGAFT